MIVEINSRASADEVLQVVGPVDQGPADSDRAGGQTRFARETCRGGTWVAREPNARAGTRPVPP